MRVSGTVNHEFRVVWPDGSEHWLHAQGKLVPDAAGTPVRFIGVTVSVDERRAQEAQMRRLQTAVDNARDMLSIVDPEGRFVYVNPAHAASHGFTVEENMRLRVQDLVVDGAPDFPENFQSLYASGRTARREEVARRKDGTLFPVDITFSPIELEGRPFLFCVLRDISARKRAGELLEMAQGRLALAESSAGLGVFSYDLRTHRIQMSAKWHELFGQSPARTPSLPRWLAAVHPDDRRRVSKALHETRIGKIHRETELRIVSPDGPVRWLTIYAHADLDEQSRPIRVHAVAVDTTERRRVEQALADREAHLRTILESEPECVKLLAEDGTLLEMNPAGLAMIEADLPGHVVGRKLGPMLLGLEEQHKFAALQQRVFAGESGMLELEITTLKGNRRWIETHTAPLKDAAGRVVSALAVTREITARKQAEQELRASETRQRILSDVSRILLEPDEDDTCLARIMQSLEGGFTDVCSMRFVSPDGQWLEAPRASWARGVQKVPPEIALAQRLSMNQPYAQQSAVRTGEARLFATLSPQDHEEHLSPEQRKTTLQFGVHSMLVVPLREGTRTVGVFCLMRRSALPAYTAQDLALAQEVADRAMMALTSARLTRELRQEMASRKALEEERSTMIVHLHELTAHLEQSREEERKRIAREIHDELGQQLTSLKMRLDYAFRAALDPAEASRQRSAISREVEDAIRAVRKIATELRPGLLDNLGLEPALEWLVDNCRARYGIQIDSAFESFSVDDSTATAVFRVAQEALTNVAKHSQASRVSIRLFREDQTICLDVSDNGVGLTPASTRAGFGLLGMKERATLAGGTLEVLPSDQGGVRVHLTLPAASEKQRRDVVPAKKSWGHSGQALEPLP
jgi:PAS domain S-box-containing protein